MNRDVLEILEEYKTKVNERLEIFFDQKINEALLISGHLKDILVHGKEFTMRGGKRLRPVFFIFGYKCVGGEDVDAIIDASLSMELMQSYLLIHDDIYDEGTLRRGRPTTHIVFKEICDRQYGGTGSIRFGENMAILAGDILESYGEEIIARSQFNDKYVARALRKYTETVQKVNYGQVLDILSEKKDNITEEDILMIQKLKTATYTIEGPLHIGGLLGGATEKDIKIMSEYGIPLGQAFQIQDDILGLFGSEKQLGKSVGSDIKEGKKTLLILKALERCEEDQKDIILNALGNKNISNKEVEAVRKVVQDTGSLDYSKKLAQELTDIAINTIKKSDFTNEGKEFLIKIGEFIANREY